MILIFGFGFPVDFFPQIRRSYYLFFNYLFFNYLYRVCCLTVFEGSRVCCLTVFAPLEGVLFDRGKLAGFTQACGNKRFTGFWRFRSGGGYRESNPTRKGR